MLSPKVRCIGNRFLLDPQPDGSFLVTQGAETSDVRVGEVYELLGVEDGWFRIVDESGEDYLYPAEMFEILADRT